MKELKVCPSILSANFYDLKKDILFVRKAGVDIIHVDVMDGHFVSNISFGSFISKSISLHSDIYEDVHLMVSNPLKHIDQFFLKGVLNITFHIECEDDPLKCIEAIKSFGCSCGLAINPGTAVENVVKYLDFLDLVLVMTVNPGFEGQKFMPEMLEKVAILRKLKPSLNIEVDGGINDKNAFDVYRNGANFLVAGSYIFRSPNIVKSIKSLKRAAVR